jgi:hypothetical protein
MNKTVLVHRGVKNLYEAHRIAWHIYGDKTAKKRDFLFRFISGDGISLFHLRSTSDHPGAQQGSKVRIELSACPSRRDIKTGDRRPVVHKTEAIGWLAEQGCHRGFTVTDVTAVPRYAILKKPGLKPDVVALWSFTAIATITDADLFNHAVAYGIGKLRSFGQGMIVFEPLKEQSN